MPTNVNARRCQSDDALSTAKLAALADVFSTLWTARLSADSRGSARLSRLADCRQRILWIPAVRAWWHAKVDEGPTL